MIMTEALAVSSAEWPRAEGQNLLVHRLRPQLNRGHAVSLEHFQDLFIDVIRPCREPDALNDPFILVRKSNAQVPLLLLPGHAGKSPAEKAYFDMFISCGKGEKMLFNDFDHLCTIRYVPPAGDLLLVAEHALERTGQLREEERYGIAGRFQFSF
jgi:hypothetical protein